MNEVLLGAAVGVAEGTVETFVPQLKGLIDKGNKSMKDVAAAGYMAGEISRGLTKAALAFLILL